jgi:hypothetical protein
MGKVEVKEIIEVVDFPCSWCKKSVKLTPMSEHICDAEKNVNKTCKNIRKQIIRILKESEEVRECGGCKHSEESKDNKKRYSCGMENDTSLCCIVLPEHFGCIFWEKKK